MSYVFQLPLAKESLPGLRLHLWVTDIMGVGPNKSPPIEPEISEEAVMTRIRYIVPIYST